MTLNETSFNAWKDFGVHSSQRVVPGETDSHERCDPAKCHD